MKSVEQRIFTMAKFHNQTFRSRLGEFIIETHNALKRIRTPRFELDDQTNTLTIHLARMQSYRVSYREIESCRDVYLLAHISADFFKRQKETR